MSLHQLANHMSAQGRGPDSTLVHMTPREVEGLQKLALAHGTTLTINPQTGLPEAFSLKDLLPTIAGAALNYFAPGFGTAIGGALGLSGAAGTGLAVGAATAALSGDLGKGLQAGLGAYGGAGITDSLTGMGAGYLGSQAVESAVADATTRGLTGDAYNQAVQDSVTNRMASATMSDKLEAGLSYAKNNPMTALKTGAKYLAAAASPAIFAGDVGNTVQTVTPKRPSTPISNEKFDPYSQTFARNQPRSNDGYDPYAQMYSRSAAKGGLMGLAHGGAVHYEEGGPVGAAVPFNMDDYLRNYVKRFEPLAATNTGQGFAATAAPVTQATPVAAATAAPANIFAATDYFDPNANFMSANPADTTSKNTAFANSAGAAAPVAQAGIAALPNAGAAMSAAAPITWTGQAQSPLITDQVNDLFRNVLDRPPSQSDMDYWATAFGKNNNTIDPNEVADFKSAASKELAARTADFNSSKNYIPISKLDDLYMQELSRHGEYGTNGKEGGMEFWKRTFGDYIDPTELAGFKAEAAKEIAKRPVVVNPVVQNPAVVTDLTTAGTQYIAPGVGGSTGAGQIGGGTVVNPNGTITTSPRIPNIPVGGFEGMNQVRDSYTKGGGNLGYTSYAPTTIAEFNEKYKNTGYQKEMYDYLMGKGDMPTKMKNADGTYREIMRPYNEATLGVPSSTNKRLTWDKTKGEYFRNRDYVRQKTITDPVTKEKSVRNYMSINSATAALTDKPYTIKELMSWADRNFVDSETLSQVTGLKPFELQKLRYDADEIGAKPEKKVWVNSKPAAKGGLMSLANGGVIGYDEGGPVEGEYIDSTTGDKYILDNRYGGGYRKEKVTKDGLNYKWDKVSNSYKLAGADAGLNSLVNMTGGGGGGNDGITSNTTPNWGTAFQIGKTLSNMGLNTIGGYLERAATNGILGQSNEAAKAADAMPSNPVNTSMPQGYDTAASRAGVGSSPYGGGSGLGSGGARGAHADANNPLGGDVTSSTPNGPSGAPPGPDAGGPVDVGGGFDVGNAPSGDNAKGGMIGHYAQGGLGSLGGYSDGGRLLRGPGDGVSDSIPATVGDRQPARLADGEFVVPARIVSELGNGSTEAGARALYKMMDRIQANRRKTTGKNNVAVNSKSHKYLPA